MKIASAQIDNFIQKIAAEKICGCLVFGPESSLAAARSDVIAKQIVPDLSDPFLVAHLSKERLSNDKAALADEFFSLSMLGGRKLIIVKDCDVAVGAALKLIVEDKDFAKKTDNFLLIQAGDLDKSSALRKICEDSASFAALACYEDDERSIKKFIQEELVKKQLQFDAQIIEIFLEKFGKNRQLILAEIEKILVFLGEKKTLSAEDFQTLTASESEISINEFAMSFAAKNFEVAFTQLEKLFRSNVDAIMLLRFLSNYLQKLYQARIDMDCGRVDFEEAVKNQRLFFKAEAEFRKILNNSSLNFLIKILQEVEKLEVKIKKGQMPPKIVLTAFMQGLLVRKTSA